MQGHCDVYKQTILKRTSPKVKCLHPTSSRREMCTSSISIVIYHEFSHGTAFYTLSGKNVNVMLEFCLMGKVLSGDLSCMRIGLVSCRHMQKIDYHPKFKMLIFYLQGSRWTLQAEHLNGDMVS